MFKSPVEIVFLTLAWSLLCDWSRKSGNKHSTFRNFLNKAPTNLHMYPSYFILHTCHVSGICLKTGTSSFSGMISRHDLVQMNRNLAFAVFRHTETKLSCMLHDFTMAIKSLLNSCCMIKSKHLYSSIPSKWYLRFIFS